MLFIASHDIDSEIFTLLKSSLRDHSLFETKFYHIKLFCHNFKRMWGNSKGLYY